MIVSISVNTFYNIILYVLSTITPFFFLDYKYNIKEKSQSYPNVSYTIYFKLHL